VIALSALSALFAGPRAKAPDEISLWKLALHAYYDRVVVRVGCAFRPK